MSIFASPVTILAWILGVGALAGSIYQLLAIVAVRHLTTQERPDPVARPPVTLLKPLCGDEPGLYENLLSFCRQSYPTIQLVCGVRAADDPAIAVVRRLQATTPDIDIALVIDPAIHGANYKVSNLINMMSAAKYDLLVLSDSDMRARPDYLDRVVATLERPGAGLATCLYVGRPQPDFWSRLGAAGINFWFLPSAAVSKLLGGAVGCYGATLGFTRQTLEAIGGFAALKDHLADDYEMGVRVRSLGKSVSVVPYIIDTIVQERGFKGFLRHEVRWARTIRNSAPAGYAGSAITHATPLALAAGGLGLTVGVPWSMLAANLALAWICRMALVGRVRRSLDAPGLRWWQLLIRDVLSLAILILAYCGRSVSWRDSAFRLSTGGALVVEGETGA